VCVLGGQIDSILGLSGHKPGGSILQGLANGSVNLVVAERERPGSEADHRRIKIKQVLLVDDSRSQRRILSVYLSRWGYSVVEAASGAEALEILETNPIDLIVSDWVMPGMDGLELCRRFRALARESHGYFILLTSKSEKGEVALGLDVGADDFLTKPVAATEFLARIRAGERVLEMERELTQKNRLVSETLAEISTLYESLNRDLVEARNLQQSLLRQPFVDFDSAKLSLMLRPSGHVGGDLVGHFPISETQIGLFAMDVSGHGVASALMTARLAGHLSGSTPEQNLALARNADRAIVARPPSEVASDLNRLLLENIETELYFTMLLGHVDLISGDVTLTQCGHPHPVIQRAGGQIEMGGEGGTPVGLIDNAQWQDFQMRLFPGDRLLLMSDGVTECPAPDGEMLDDEGLVRLLRRNARLRGEVFFETLIWDLVAFSGDKDFPDDISAVMVEFDGPP